MNRVYKKGIYCVSLHLMYFINLHQSNWFQISGFIQNNQKLQQLAFGWQSSNEANKKFASFTVHPSQPVTWTVTQLISKPKVQLQKFTKILSYKKITCENVLTLTWGHLLTDPRPLLVYSLTLGFRPMLTCAMFANIRHQHMLKKETWKSTN